MCEGRCPSVVPLTGAVERLESGVWREPWLFCSLLLVLSGLLCGMLPALPPTPMAFYCVIKQWPKARRESDLIWLSGHSPALSDARTGAQGRDLGTGTEVEEGHLLARSRVSHLSFT